MKEKVKIGLIKFTVCNPALTLKLKQMLPKEFEYIKIKFWINILNNENAYVESWNNPNTKGLRAKCKPLENKEQYKEQIKIIRKYTEEVNERLGTKYAISYELEVKSNG